MKKKRDTDEQIGFVLRQAETGTPIGGSVPQDGDFGTDLLSLEEEVCRAGRGRDPTVKATGRGEPTAEDVGRRSDAGQNDVAGGGAPKVVRPSRRRSLVAWLRRAYQVSERQVCGADRVCPLVPTLPVHGRSAGRAAAGAQGVGGGPSPVRVSSPACAASTGGLADQRQAGLSSVQRGRLEHPPQDAAPAAFDPLPVWPSCNRASQ